MSAKNALIRVKRMAQRPNHALQRPVMAKIMTEIQALADKIDEKGLAERAVLAGCGALMPV